MFLIFVGIALVCVDSGLLTFRAFGMVGTEGIVIWDLNYNIIGSAYFPVIFHEILVVSAWVLVLVGLNQLISCI